MMAEVNLLDHYPKAKRGIADRAQTTEADRELSRRFGYDYFDGDRRHGYGGYTYRPGFWQPTVDRFCQHYRLTKSSRVLDVGCAKGFMLNDLRERMPGIRVLGVDVSSYAVEHGHPAARPFMLVGDAIALPFPDRSFDLVISLNTIHNLDLDECKTALAEIQRVSRRDAFITVDAWRTDDERERMEQWVLTAKTMMHVDDWKRVFAEAGYAGDFYWFIA